MPFMSVWKKAGEPLKTPSASFSSNICICLFGISDQFSFHCKCNRHICTQKHASWALLAFIQQQWNIWAFLINIWIKEYVLFQAFVFPWSNIYPNWKGFNRYKCLRQISLNRRKTLDKVSNSFCLVCRWLISESIRRFLCGLHISYSSIKLQNHI